ncbi:hypothetical protein P4E94_16855, partial [Pontiellaceae bacterium B12219]|nr:hypothetical protein [Pontiellaceae bacterium B12219]
MDLSNLTKEQKQYIVLGGLVVVGLVAGLIFGLGKLMSSVTEDKMELEDLSAKVSRAERTLSGYSKIVENFEQTIMDLEGYLDNVPPDQNYYSWATEIIYAKGRRVGLEIESVDEIGMSGAKINDPNNPVYFEAYSLRITARGGYQQLKNFLQDVERNHPLVRFTGLEIGRGRQSEVHVIQLVAQWPFKLNRITKLWEGHKIRSQRAVAKTSPSAEPASVVSPVSAPEPEPIVKAPGPEIAVKQPTAPPPRVSVPKPVKSEPAVAVAKPEPTPAPKPIVKTPEPEVAVKQPTAPPPRVSVPKPAKSEPAVAVAKPEP